MSIIHEVSEKCAKRISEVRYSIRDDKEFEVYVEAEVALAISSNEYLLAMKQAQKGRNGRSLRVLFLGCLLGLAMMLGMKWMFEVAPESCAAVILLIAAWRMATWGFDLSKWVFSLGKED